MFFPLSTCQGAVQDIGSQGFYFIPAASYHLDPNSSRYVLKTYIVLEELPKELRNFADVKRVMYNKESTSHEILEDYFLHEEEFIKRAKESKSYNTNGMMSLKYRSQKAVVFLYDSEYNLMGYHIVEPTEYSDYSSLKKYLGDVKVTFEQAISEDLITNKVTDFQVTRKINGVVDPNFQWRGGGSSSIYDSSGNVTGIIFHYFFFDNDSVEYEIESLNPNFKVKSVEKVPSHF